MIKYILIIIGSCAGIRLNAQTHKVKIIDSLTGQPLFAATAETLNDSIHLQTNKKGEFVLPVLKSEDTLLISYIGYKPRYIQVSSIVKNDFFINMARSEGNLQEVSVSTGYQTIPKERATGSFYKITNKELNQRVSSNILDRMENLAPGILYDKRNTNEPYKIQVRGLSTLTEGISQPLIIVNNFPYTGDINDINPDDVKDITILRDAAAASIWGAKAGNGVIVISLKTPTAAIKPKISFNSSLTYTAAPDLFNANQISVSDYIDVEEMLYKNGFYAWNFNNPSYPPVTPVVDILYREEQGVISAEKAKKSIDSLRKFDVRNDMQKYLYRSGYEQRHDLNITGGGPNFKYLLSAGIDKNMQTLKGNDNRKITLHWNNEALLTKHLTVNTDVIYTQSNSNTNSPGSYNFFGSKFGSTLYPYARLVNADGSAAALDINWSRTFTDTAGGGELLDWKLRPLDELNNNDNTTVSRRLLATLGVTYAIYKYLSLDIKSQYGISTTISNDNRNINSFYARDLINKFTNLSSNEPNIRYPIPMGGVLIYANSNEETYDFRGQINYTRQWQNKHSLSVIAGAEVRQEASDRKRYTYYGYNSKTLNLKDIDLVNQYPTFDNVSGNQYLSGGSAIESYLNRFVSYYGNASYTYQNKYTISSSVRKDQSNLFGVETNQKGVPLWSVGGAWKISRESFYNIDWLSYLNLRLTYGKSGNVNNSVSALATIRYGNPSGSTIKVPYASIDNYPNPDLRWEQVNMFNTGIDFSALNNKLAGSVEYYRKKSIDLLNGIDIDPSSGMGVMTANSASLKGHGIDIALNVNILNKQFSWQTSLLLSYTNYKVIKTSYDESLINFVSNGEQIFPKLGYNPYLIVSYKWGGLDNEGNPQGYAKGELTTDYTAIRKDSINEQVIAGSALPTYFGNLRNTFDFKGFSLAFNINYKMGYYLRKPTINYYNLFYSGQGDKEFANRWQRPGDENSTNVPSMIYPIDQNRVTFYRYSSINVIDAANVKLTDIYLSYSLQQRWRKPIFSSLQLYGTLNNLNIMLWKANKADIDPDFPTGLISPKIIAFGIKGTF